MSIVIPDLIRDLQISDLIKKGPEHFRSDPYVILNKYYFFEEVVV